jgi:anhydro-N-acetylmuramic acid kinase
MSRAAALRVLGLMSGTSADGMDVALVRISGAPPRISARLDNFADIRFSRGVREAVLRLANGAPTTTAELSQLNFLLGEEFARAVREACRRFRVPLRQINLIGSHGQTVYHQGAPSRFLGAHISSTLQIGEPAIIAARTGIPTVGDFRVADMAAGGQGAPLVPFVDYLLYRHARRGRVALNLGGIANVTVIPAAAQPADVFAFDTGPGNMVIDALVRHFTRGRHSFDRDARIARRGCGIPALLNDLLRDPYLRRKPPKTCGREQYGADFAARLIAWGRKPRPASPGAGRRARPEDLVRTATLLTALSIWDAFHRFIFPRARLRDLIVSGGGAHNPLLMALLQALLPAVRVAPSSAFGVPEDAKEAFAFALLAYESFHRRPANLPAATGARGPAILGKVSFPPPR